jgi:hypothetical protein
MAAFPQVEAKGLEFERFFQDSGATSLVPKAGEAPN